MATSLGTLTLDLVTKIGNFVGPVQQAEKQTKVSFDNMRKHVNMYGSVVAGIAGSAAVALGAMVAQTANQAAELEVFANRANTTTQEFQKMAVGAKAMGIEGESLSMMFRDFNEKLGELTAVGGGGAKDFFDKLSGQMKGGSQEAKSLILEMQKLSGPEALQLYVDRLEEAGVSQQEMSFYLESMASDLTDLYPLLANGGEGMKLYGDMAERAGIIMTDKTREAALALKDQMFMLDLQFQGAKNQLMTAVIPAFVDVAGAFFSGSEQGLQFTAVAEGVGTAIRTIGKVAVGATATIQMFGKGLGGLAAAGAALVSGDFAGAKAILSELRLDISTTALDAAAKMDAIDNRVGSSKSSQLRGIREIQQRNASTATGLQDVIDKENKAAKATEGRAKAARQANEAISKQAKELTAEEIKLKELQFAWEVTQHRLTEDEAFRYKYSVDQQAIRADKELTQQQKEIKLQALKEIYEDGYTALKISQEKELLEAKQMWMSAGDYAKEYYALVRKEILNTASYSPKKKEALIKQANAQEGIDANKVRESTWDQYQNRFGVQELPYDQDIALLKAAQDQMLISEEDYQKKKLQLQAAYGGQYASEFAGMMMGLVDSSSTAYRVLGGIQKGAALFSTAVNSYQAISAAWASAPFPYNLPAVGMATMETGLLQAAVSALSPPGYADGGFTGYGGKYDPAGIVHKGEGVLTQEEIKALGGPAGFEALRHSIKNGFADGGIALGDSSDFSVKVPKLSGIKSEGPQVNVVVENYTTGQVQTKVDQDGRIRVIIREEMDKYIPGQMSNPNSNIHKAVVRNTTATTKR